MTRKHAVIMILCCLIPIGVLAAVSVFRIPLSTVLTTAIVLLCPLSMLFMMRSMAQDHDEHHQHSPIEAKIEARKEE